jgi:hypothetical protein
VASADGTRKISSGCHSFVDQVYGAFPCEIRDMIWTSLFALDPKATEDLELALYSSVLGLPGVKIDDEDLEPWFVQIQFMGVFARREMLELRYRHCFTIFYGSMLSELYSMTRVDPHNIGLIPVHFVQKERITWSFDEGLEPLHDPEYWPTERFRLTWKACFNALRQTENKERFDMELRVEDQGGWLSIKNFAHSLRTFRPVYTEHLEAGAIVKIYKGRHHVLLHNKEVCRAWAI